MIVEVNFGKRRSVAEMPLSFSGMSPGQFVTAVRYRTGNCNAEVLLRSLLGLRQGKRYALPMWVQYELVPHIGYVEDLSEPLNHFIIPEISVRLRLMKRRYLSPKPMLSGMSLQQFMSVDNFFQFYTSTQKEEFLFRFLACLYLRQHRGFSGRKLVDIEGEADMLKRIDPDVAIAIYVNWILLKNWLSRTFRHLFAGGGDGSGSRKGTDWLEIFDSFVGDHVAEMESYQRMECMDAFRIMNNKIKESKKNRK